MTLCNQLHNSQVQYTFLDSGINIQSELGNITICLVLLLKCRAQRRAEVNELFVRDTGTLLNTLLHLGPCGASGYTECDPTAEPLWRQYFTKKQG